MDYLFVDYDGYIEFLTAIDEDGVLDESELSHADSQWDKLQNICDDYNCVWNWIYWLTDTITSTAAGNSAFQGLNEEDFLALAEKLFVEPLGPDMFDYYDKNGDGTVDWYEQD